MSAATMIALPANYRSYELPWVRSAEEQQRLKKVFMTIAGVCAVLGLVMPFLPSQPVRNSATVDVPPRLAKLLIERKTPPPPPPQVITPPEEASVPEPEVKPEPKPKPKPAVAPPPPKEPVQVAIAPPPEVVPPVEQAREKAARSGLAAMADELAELRDNSAADAALNKQALANAVGAAEKTERSLLTSAGGRASGGINTASLSRNTGGQGLAGRSVTEVETPVGVASGAVQARAARSEGSASERSRDQIEMIFDRNKAAIYSLYRRALREDPSLQGKLVLELTIDGSGQVLECKVVSSELNAPEFEARLIKRVRLFDFGAQDVGTITTTKPIDFFPA